MNFKMGIVMPRYIIADTDMNQGWSHIFTEYDLERDRQVERERTCRFVFDNVTKKLLHLEINRNFGYAPATAAEISDLEDSLVNANPEALLSPDYWGGRR
jgi:hypothetical protein